ncbi:MAG: BamA/TamA family outer membrane protein [Calditrichaeota bacterium]|nr:BamA/TamA family outer membrane protein [Calditrichota bacterium]
MKKTYLTTLLILIAISSELTAADSDLSLNPLRINFHSDRFSHSELIELAEVREVIYNRSELEPALKRLYKSLAKQGYPLVELDSCKYNNNDIIDIYISSGKVVKISDSVINGINRDDIQGFSYDKMLSEEMVLRKIEGIHDQLNDIGYPFAQVRLEPGYIVENKDYISAQLDLDIVDGGFTRIRGIEFPGVRLNKPRLLRLESGFRRGDVFSHIRLKRALDRLERLPFIESTGEPLFESAGSGLINIHIPIEERRVNTVSGIISAAQGQEDPSGELKLKFGNILGTGRKLQLEWLNLDPTRRGIIINYREPWIMGYPWHCTIGLEQWSEDTLGTTTRYKFGLEWEPADRFILSGSAVRESISASDRVQSKISSDALWLEGGVSFDRLDYNWNPSSGYFFQIFTATAVRSYKNSNRESNDLKRQRLFQTGVSGLTDHIVVFQHIGIDDISGSGVIMEDLVRIGGSGTVRGYGENVIMAKGTIWGNLELRWRPDKTSWLGIFNDLGYVYREDENINARERYPFSYGLTSGMITKVGRLGLDIALAKGEAVQNARLHVRLEAWF